MPQPHIFQTLVRVIAGLPGYPKLNLLDLSCGEGELMSRLQADGVTVRGTHFREDDYIVENRERLAALTIDSNVDLTKELPYPAESFDVVVMSEVLEHLPAHLPVVASVSRVLRKGGFFVFTTPNIHRFHSRMRYLFTGTHKLIRRRAGWDLEPNDLYAYHINCVDFPFMHAALHAHGLNVEALHFTRFKWYRFEWLLAYPCIWLRCLLNRETAGNANFQTGERALFHWMTHPALLASEQLCVVSRKRN